MKKWIRYLLLGVVAYGAFLALTFPAAYAYRLIHEQLNGVQMGGIEGTVWSGSARTLGINGFYLQNVGWEMRFLPLLLGRLELKLDSTDKEFRFSTYAGRTLGGKVYLRGFQGQFPVASLQALTPFSVPAVGGELVFDALDVGLADGKYLEGAGNIFWKEASVTVGSPLELGGFAVELKTEEKEITGILKDTGGPLRAEGVLKLSPEGSYHFSGRFTPRNGEEGELARNLRMLGPPDPAGSYVLEYTGQLPAPVL